MIRTTLEGWKVNSETLVLSHTFYCTHGTFPTIEDARNCVKDLIFEDSIRERRNYLAILADRMARSITYPSDVAIRKKTPGEMMKYSLARYGRPP